MGSYQSQEMPEPSQMTLRLFKASTFFCGGLTPFSFNYKASSEENGPYLTAEMMSPSDPNHSQYNSSRQPHSPAQNPVLTTTLQSLRPRPDPTLCLSPINPPSANSSSPPLTSDFLVGLKTAFPSISTQQQTPFQPFLQCLPLPDLIPLSNDSANEVPPCSPFGFLNSPLTFDILESGLSSRSQSPLERPGPLSTPDISSIVSSGYINCNASSPFLFEWPNNSLTFDVPKRNLAINNRSNNEACSSLALQRSEASPTSDPIKGTWELASPQRLPSSHSPTSQLCETLSCFDNTGGSIHSSSQATSSLSCLMEFQQEPCKCPHCDDMFQTDSQRDCHVASIHKNRCQECKFDFKKKQYLIAHMKWKHNPEAGMRHPCSQCDRKYTYPGALATHMKEKHSEEANVRYPCSQCESKYGSRSSLARHIKEKHTPNAVLHGCPHCHKKFPNNSRLKLHINAIHENVRYPCSQCEYKYPYSADLTRHMKEKHTPDGAERLPT